MEHTPTHIGAIIYPDLEEMKNLTDDVIQDYPATKIHARIIQNPKENNRIFLADLPNTDEEWGGNFRCFLYPDDCKFLGTYHYLKEANQDDEKIDASYKMDGDTLIISGLGNVKGIPTYGIYLELYPFEDV